MPSDTPYPKKKEEEKKTRCSTMVQFESCAVTFNEDL